MAKLLAEIRQDLVPYLALAEAVLAFSREVKTPALEKLINDVETAMKEALDRNGFGQIYSAYLKVIKDRPLSKFVYDADSAYYADYPQIYFK